jgi:hypothetical protein
MSVPLWTLTQQMVCWLQYCRPPSLAMCMNPRGMDSMYGFWRRGGQGLWLGAFRRIPRVFLANRSAGI